MCNVCVSVWERIKKGLSNAMNWLKKPSALQQFEDLAKPYAEKLPSLRYVMDHWTDDVEFGRQVSVASRVCLPGQSSFVDWSI